MQPSVLLEPRRRFALGGSFLLLGMLLLPLGGEYRELRHGAVHDVVQGAGYRASFIVLITLAVVVPILAFVVVRQTNRAWLSPTEIIVGRRRVPWSDIHEVTWKGHRGGNALVLHVGNGRALTVPASMYEGGEARVLMLLKQYLPVHILASAEAELRASE